MSRKVIVGALTKQVAKRSAKLRRTQDGQGLIDSPRGESIFVTWSPKIFHEARCGAQSQRHSLPCILALATGAVLCGMEGYKAIGGWAEDLGQKARARFGCRKRNGRYEVPSRTTFRETLIGVNPEHLDLALQNWNEQFAKEDEGLAVDGKTMRNAIDEEGRQTHILGVVGHQTDRCHTKKSGSIAGSGER